MSISIHKKVNFLTSTIASTAISIVGVFATFEINHQAKAIVVPGNPSDYIVSPGSGYDGVVSLLLEERNLFHMQLGILTSIPITKP